jgi:hypothetical protein
MAPYLADYLWKTNTIFIKQLGAFSDTPDGDKYRHQVSSGEL